MTRVLVIGIDGLDRHLLARLAERLPNLTRMAREGVSIESRSVFPPDTPSAWASIYTGQNPARHGVLRFIDPLDRATTRAYQQPDEPSLQGKTFWDAASAHGRRTCILFPELGYPAWDVNGVMVGRTGTPPPGHPSVDVRPASAVSAAELASVAPFTAVPDRHRYREFTEANRRLLEAERELGLRMWQRERWELFFIFCNALDWVGHNLWAYFDEKDPSHPGASPFQDTIPHFYELCDRMVGEFLAFAGPDTVTIVLSDHGQGMRPYKLVNINEALRRRGLLAARMRSASLRDPYYALERLKRAATSAASRFGIAGTLARLLRLAPAVKRVYTASPSIDWQATRAYVSDLSGIKAYPYCGVVVPKDRLSDEEYEEVRSAVLEELGRLSSPEDGEALVRWACRREELYAGEHIKKYPDIVLELAPEYGAGWAVHEPLVTETNTHSIQSGSHRMDSAVFLAWGAGVRARRQTMRLEDVAPTVLSLLGLSPGEGEPVLEVP